MQYKEVKQKSDQELGTELKRLRGEVAKLSVEKRQGSLKSPKELKGHKKTIARILTALNEQK